MLTGSTVCARAPYGREEVNFAHKGSSILATNYLPRVREGVGRPIKRRLRIIHCSNTIDEDKAILNYHKVLLKNGGEGFLRRFVEGYQGFLREGLMPSPEMMESISEYTVEEDPLNGFVDNCLIQDKNSSIDANILYNIWQDYCRLNGYGERDGSVTDRRVFGKRLIDQLKARRWEFEKKKSGDRRTYHGITINPESTAFFSLRYSIPPKSKRR